MTFQKPTLHTPFSILFFFLMTLPLHGQTIKVQPYLQDATPHSINISWETDMGEESLVEWGLTDTLGQRTIGTSFSSVGSAMIHEVKLEGLDRFTKYYYRVITGSAQSEIFHFKTPPFARDQRDTRLIAMSDMQRDGSQPDKFREVVNEGILTYLRDEYGGDIVDHLALVMIPGDLVVTGTTYSQWENHFFDPSHGLFNHVPLYPVLGNHEANTTYYFQYFKMPENGTPGYEEHWWYKDYSNIRIVGLNSNSPFTNQDQLDWLSDLLDTTCSIDSIDFVFAQLHHPHKSELWTPGESNFTGEVIELLEEFSTTCGKPSIHFFGHTHGYSRGASRDHKHLWINVATAGGAIDYWGEFPNFDYDEFSVSQDEYGFLEVEVTNDEDPRVIIKRISRGNRDNARDNEVTDSLTMRKGAMLVETPKAISPKGEVLPPECIELVAAPFSAPDPSSLHGQSHWQVSTTEDFTSIEAESWKTYQNWYDNVNTQEGDDISDEEIIGLNENTTYWWRVRYRDREFNWSDWSDPSMFQTGASILGPNLLDNPGAEDSLSGWTVRAGVVEALTSGVCNGIAPYRGERYFIVGGLCTESDQAECFQNVDVSMYAESIDEGEMQAHYGGYLSNYAGSDQPELFIAFLDQNGNETKASEVLSTLNDTWTMLGLWDSIPPGTRTIQMTLRGTRRAGQDNDSYFDDLFLRVQEEEVRCDDLVGTGSNPQKPIPLSSSPNPAVETTSISLPSGLEGEVDLRVIDEMGRKLTVPYKVSGGKVILNRGNIPAGTYSIIVKNNGRAIGTARVIFVQD